MGTDLGLVFRRDLLSGSLGSALRWFGVAGGVSVFASGKEAEQLAVGYGAESFGAVAIVAEAASGKDRRANLSVFGFQSVERGEGDAVSAIEVVEGFKEFGFALAVRARVRELRKNFRACSFTNSHGGLL
jgi:hypothetical protein